MKTNRNENRSNRMLKEQHYYLTLDQYPNILDKYKVGNYGRNFSRMEVYNVNRIFEAAVFFNRYYLVKWMLDKYGHTIITKEIAYPIYANINYGGEKVYAEIAKHIPYQMLYSEILNEILDYVHTCPLSHTIIESKYNQFKELLNNQQGKCNYH